LAELGFNSEATAWQLATVQMLQRLARAPGDHCASVIPWLADALQKLSEQYGRQKKFELALQASRQSLDLHQFSSETSSEVDNRTSYVSALVLHSRNLRSTQQPLAAISIAKEAVQRCRPMLPEIMMQMSGPGALSPDEMEYKVTMYLSSFLALAQAFASVGRLRGAAKAAAEALDSLPKTLQIFSHPQSTAHRTLEIFARGPSLDIVVGDQEARPSVHVSFPYLSFIYRRCAPYHLSRFHLCVSD
jgi:tetratricopeptide (TPR) repeat protein